MAMCFRVAIVLPNELSATQPWISKTDTSARARYLERSIIADLHAERDHSRHAAGVVEQGGSAANSARKRQVEDNNVLLLGNGSLQKK